MEGEDAGVVISLALLEIGVGNRTSLVVNGMTIMSGLSAILCSICDKGHTTREQFWERERTHT